MPTKKEYDKRITANFKMIDKELEYLQEIDMALDNNGVRGEDEITYEDYQLINTAVLRVKNAVHRSLQMLKKGKLI